MTSTNDSNRSSSRAKWVVKIWQVENDRTKRTKIDEVSFRFSIRSNSFRATFRTSNDEQERFSYWTYELTMLSASSIDIIWLIINVEQTHSVWSILNENGDERETFVNVRSISRRPENDRLISALFHCFLLIVCSSRLTEDFSSFEVTNILREEKDSSFTFLLQFSVDVFFITFLTNRSLCRGNTLLGPRKTSLRWTPISIN